MSETVTLLPPNASETERAISTVVAERTQSISAPIDQLWNADTCPVALLPWLAWAFSVETWEHGWSEDVKRNVIRSSIQVHRQKGTVQSVKAALKSAGYGDAEVIERFGWEFHDGAATHDGATTYAPPDHWAEYRIKLARPITVEQAAQVRALLRNVAPIRCHLKALDFTEALNIHDARITHDGQFTHGVA